VASDPGLGSAQAGTPLSGDSGPARSGGRTGAGSPGESGGRTGAGSPGESGGRTGAGSPGESGGLRWAGSATPGRARSRRLATRRDDRGRRRGRLRLTDVKVTAKLGLILVVPVVAIVALAAASAVTAAAQASRASQARALTALGLEVADLTDRLQAERAAAAQTVAEAGKPAGEAARAAFVARIGDTETAAAGYRELRAAVGAAPAVVGPLKRVDAQLVALGPLRDQVRSTSSNVPLSAVVFTYRIVIADLVAYRQALAQVGVSAKIADELRAAAALSSAREYAALEEIAVLRAMAAQSLSPQAQQEIVAARTGYNDALLSFTVLARGSWRSLLDHTVTGPELVAAQRLEGTVARTPVGTPLRLSGGMAPWSAAMAARIERLRQVERAVDDDLLAEVTLAREAQVRTVIIQSSLALVVVLFAILVAAIMARSMARSLRTLRDGALRVAYQRLPQVVADLQNPALDAADVSQVIAMRSGSPVRVAGRDEIGQVAEAFNAVHREAVRTAGEQAALRTQVSTMFVNLARRSQRLVDGVIEQLDRIERDETNPERLAGLFRLDHLTTRMRRANESLLILAGSEAGRVRQVDVAVLDVLRAAQSQVERYTRVDYGRVDTGLAVAAHAVDAVVHLLAELLDNATTYSPPEHPVIVEAYRVGDRMMLQVTDWGIGIAGDQLAAINERLARPPSLDVAASRAMGLVVVARLAARHGLRVQLYPARHTGTIAEVLLPPDAVVALENPGGAQDDGLTKEFKVASLVVPRPLERAGRHRVGTGEDAASPLFAALTGSGPDRASWFDSTRYLGRLPQPVAGGAAQKAVPATGAVSVDGWYSPADSGWRAAAAADSGPPPEATSAGLPQRTPMARLVPGAITPTQPVDEDSRSLAPEQARATLTAFQNALGRAGRSPLPRQRVGASAGDRDPR
jgi:signal transduction histidine kinase